MPTNPLAEYGLVLTVPVPLHELTAMQRTQAELVSLLAALAGAASPGATAATRAAYGMAQHVHRRLKAL